MISKTTSLIDTFITSNSDIKYLTKLDIDNMVDTMINEYPNELNNMINKELNYQKSHGTGTFNNISIDLVSLLKKYLISLGYKIIDN